MLLSWHGLLSCLSAAATSLALLVAIFVPLERLFPARTQAIFRPRWQLDAAFFLGQYLLWNLLSIQLLRIVSGTLSGAAPPLGGTALGSAIRLLVAVLLGDVLVYFFHRLCHASSFLFRFHGIHHSSEHLDWLAAHREHPVDGILTQLCQNLPAMLIGVYPDGLAALSLFRGLWAIFIHSNARLPLGPLKWMLGAPELHHWHHALGHGQTNFGNLAPWLDVVFGTHEPPPHGAYPVGLPSGSVRSFWAAMWAPFVPGR